MADSDNKSTDEKKPVDAEKKEVITNESSDVKDQQGPPPNVAPIGPGTEKEPIPPTPPGKPQQSGPLTPEELKKNAEEQDRKTMRVIQIVQHMGNQRIEVHPVQNVNVRSDVVGLLTQALNNIQNEDMMRNNAALLKEAVGMIKEEKKEQ